MIARFNVIESKPRSPIGRKQLLNVEMEINDADERIASLLAKLQRRNDSHREGGSNNGQDMMMPADSEAQ